MGCTVRQEQEGRLFVDDQATGDTYELVFCQSALQMELGSKMGFGAGWTALFPAVAGLLPGADAHGE